MYWRRGEVVAAGQPVLALLPPENLRIRFYVAGAVRATLHQGDRLRIGCDGCPPDLAARVSFIAAEAEYAPPVIYSREDRAKLTWLIEATPEGAAAGLTPGQPVTVFPAAAGRP